MEEAGAVEAESASDFIDWAKALSYMSHLRGEGNVLVVTNAGGPGVIATDALASRGLRVPPLPDRVRERLASKLPPIVSLSNPIDLTGQARDEDYKLVLEEVEGEDFYDSLLILAPVQPATMTIGVADIIADWVWRNKKPAVVMTIGSDYGLLVKEYLDSRGIPAYTMPDRAAGALYALMESSKPLCPIGGGLPAPPRAEEIIEEARREGRIKLLEHEALAVMEAYGIPVPRYCLATSRDEAGKCASIIGKPMAAKIVSPDIVHKSDVGGVVLGVAGREGAVEAFDRILENIGRNAPNARVVGVLYQEMAPSGLEVFVGGKRDPSFGPIVVFGLGGVFVEALRDVAISLAPTNKCRAMRMLGSIKARRLLEGYRGMAPRDKEAIADAIVKISSLVSNHPSIAEVDVNPLIAYDRGVLAVDARIILR